jgi:hypothetical protein
MERIEKTVYISYRHTNAYHALAVFQNLIPYGYDCFIDHRSLNTEPFTKFTENQIKARAHFVVLLTPSALASCTSANAHLRREIETALEHERNIVPLMFLGFNYDSPAIKKYLTGPLERLRYWQTQLIPEGLCDVAMERVHKRFLDIGVDVTRYAISHEAENVVARKQTAARHQPIVSERHLVIEQYLERAISHVEQGRREQGVIDFTEAIRLKPTYALAYRYRGVAHRDRGDPARALADFNEAIELEPDYAQAITDRGMVHLSQGNYVNAIVDFETALTIDPYLTDAERNLFEARQHSRR